MIKDIEKYARVKIPDDIFADMASECRGMDKDKLTQKLIVLANADYGAFNRAIWKAQYAIMFQNPDLKADQLVEQKSKIADLKAILKAAKTLDGLLSEIPDLEESPAFSLFGLPCALQSYMFTAEDWEEDERRYKETGMRECDIKLLDWDNFLLSLKQHIAIFENIQKSIKEQSKRGRPKVLAGLSEFVLQIALLYSDATGRTFTVCEYGDKDAYTEGMLFVKSALPVLYIPPLVFCTESYKEILASSRYSEENFENACAYAQRKIRELGKKSQKMG